MAVVEFDRKDLEQLVGKKLTEKDYEERIPMMGAPLESIDEKTVAYEIFPDRCDMLSIEGFARAVRYFLGLESKIPAYTCGRSGVTLRVDSSVKKVRPCISAAVVRNVRLSDEFVSSLMQVQEKLHETLGRKRKKVAIGVHDFDKTKPPFTYKTAAPESLRFIPLGMSEELSLLEICQRHEKGVRYAGILKDYNEWPVIVDSAGNVISFPPIINSELTRVSEDTTSLFIEVTGTSETAVNHVLNLLVTSFIERGCSVESVEIADGNASKITPDLTPKKIAIDINYVNRLLGVSLTPTQLENLLIKMGVGFDGKHAIIPCYRGDVMHPIDVVEDVAIAYGYGNFEPEVPKIYTTAERLPRIEYINALKEIMIGLGFQEVVTMVLSNKEYEFERMNISAEEACEIANSVSSECTICRKSILPSLLRVLTQNMHREFPQKIFEIGEVVVPDERSETGARSFYKLGCVISDSKVGYESIACVADALMRNLGVRYTLERTRSKTFIEGRAAEIKVGSATLGVMGEVHPEVLEKWNLEMPVAALEINVDALFNTCAR